MIVSTIGNCGGEPRIDNHRITVKNILGILFETEEGMKEILDTFSSLSEEEVKEVKNYLYKLLDEKTAKPECCKNCNVKDCKELCSKYSAAIMR